MPIFRGTIPAQVQRNSGFDLYGQPTLTDPQDTTVKVVSFLDTTEPTGDRSEEAASRGKLDQQITAAEILFYPNFPIEIGDIVSVFGVRLVVTGVWPRHSTRGEFQHKKVFLRRGIQ